MTPKNILKWVNHQFAAVPTDLETLEGRARAMRWFFWADHHVLRMRWHNFDIVAPGIYRSNQPDAKRFAHYKTLGIRSVINLRGESKTPFYAITQEGCAAAGLKLYTVNKLSAHRAPDRNAILQIFEIFDEAERSLLIHCKSGADRTGLISALYLIDKCGKSVAQARRQLSFRYLHIRWSTSGVLDMMLDDFARVEGTMSLREWVTNEYDTQDLATRGGRR